MIEKIKPQVFPDLETAVTVFGEKINELIDAVNKLNTKEVAEVPEEVLRKVLE